MQRQRWNYASCCVRLLVYDDETDAVFFFPMLQCSGSPKNGTQDPSPSRFPSGPLTAMRKAFPMVAVLLCKPRMKTTICTLPLCFFALKKSAPGTCLGSEGDLSLVCERLNRYFFRTGTFGQPEVLSVNSLAEKHQMTNFLPLIQPASLAALR